MIPLKDDNPTSSQPIVTYFLIGVCVVIFFIQLGSESYRTGQLFYSYGLIPSVLMGHDQLPMDLYVVPAYITIFSSMFMHGGFMHYFTHYCFKRIQYFVFIFIGRSFMLRGCVYCFLWFLSKRI